MLSSLFNLALIYFYLVLVSKIVALQQTFLFQLIAKATFLHFVKKKKIITFLVSHIHIVFGNTLDQDKFSLLTSCLLACILLAYFISAVCQYNENIFLIVLVNNNWSKMV